MHKWFCLIVCLAACAPAPPPTALPALPTLASIPTEIPLLIPWQAERGTLADAQDADTWRFGGQAGDDITLRVVDKGVLPQMQLWFADRLLAEGTTIEMILGAAGEYRVRVQTGAADTGGDYEIGLSYADNPNATPTRTPLPQVVGVPTPTPAYNALGAFQQHLDTAGDVGGRLSAAAPRHVYTYRGTAGQVLNLELNKLSGTLDPVLTLYDPQGNAMAMDDDSGGNTNARLPNIHLTHNGLYSVQAHGKGLFGEYTLRLIDSERPMAALPLPSATPTALPPYATPTLGPADADLRLQDHAPVIGNLPRQGDFQRFSLYAEAGQAITLRVSPHDGSGIRPQFEMYGPEGTLIASALSSTSAAGGSAFASGIVLPEAGAYILIVTGEDGTQGAFTISYGVGASSVDVFQGQALVDMRHTANISQRGQRHVWQLEVYPGDVLTIAASPLGELLNPVVELVSAEGALLARDDDGGANRAALIRAATIDAPGIYLLRVYDALGGSTGGYALMWRRTNTSAAAAPTANLAEAAILTANDRVDENAYQFYVFQGRAGQLVRVEAAAQAGSLLDPVIALLDPRGATIAEADDTDGSINPSLIATLPSSGTYTVRVNGYLSSGAFRLRVLAVSEQP